jgi:NAD(P)-dependent dehydrogenase (short-subunit alcohol dehydrogenase family)
VDDLGGKVAVVTGGGSGIGRALALSFAREGMQVVVADIERDAATRVALEVESCGTQALAVETDVADRGSVEGLADAAYAAFGEVNVLCNNAGVFVMGPITEMIVEDWRWLISVNVMGVVHGIHAFLPRLLVQDGPAHIVNTSSVAGLGGGASTSVYSMTKSAVLSISESLHAELLEHGIGVTVLCPGNISSRILGAQRNRPSAFGRLADEPFGRDLVDYGLEPTPVGDRVVRAIKHGELYAFAFPLDWTEQMLRRSRQRFDTLLAAVGQGAIGA